MTLLSAIKNVITYKLIIVRVKSYELKPCELPSMDPRILCLELQLKIINNHLVQSVGMS